LLGPTTLIEALDGYHVWSSDRQIGVVVHLLHSSDYREPVD
jgi:hypothetical protein